MQQWQYLLLIVLSFAGLGAIAGSYLAVAKLRKQRDFTRRLETLLQPRETVQVICPGPKGRWILTNKRLILEIGQRFDAFPFEKIGKVSGQDETGKATVAAAKMQLLTVKAGERELTLRRQNEDFTDFVKGLKAGVSAAKAKKKRDNP